MFSRSFLSIVSILPLLWSISSSQSTSTACNNSPDLCNVSYGNITHLGAHDSPFVRDESNGFTTSGNQFYDSVAQLDAGVRLLSAQVHRTNGSDGNPAWHLCHTSCQLLDVGTLSDWLSTIKAWLDSNPNEVVTILLVNSDKASAETLAAEYQSAGIVPYVYTPASASPPQVWPTLNELISANTRLVSFVTNLPAASNAAAPYLMDEFAYVFETAFENFSPSDFNCTVDRPSTFSGDAGSAAIAAGLPAAEEPLPVRLAVLRHRDSQHLELERDELARSDGDGCFGHRGGRVCEPVGEESGFRVGGLFQRRSGHRSGRPAERGSDARGKDAGFRGGAGGERWCW